MQRTHAARAAGWVAAFVFAAIATDASALSHYLYARAGSQFQTDSTSDINQDFVEALFQEGVPGTNANSLFHHAQVHSDTGHLAIASSIAWGESPFPLDVANFSLSVASVEQTFELTRTAPGNPVTVRATLIPSGGADIDGPTTGAVYLSAFIDINGCRLFKSTDVYVVASTMVEYIDNYLVGCRKLG